MCHNDEEEKDDELVKTPSNSTDNEDETNVKDETKGDEDEGMDYTTNQFDDDVNVRLNEPVTTDEGFIQKEGTDAEMTNVQQGNETIITESLPIFTTVIPQSLPSFTPPLQQSTPTPPPTTEATNPLSTLPNFASGFQFNNRITALEKEVAKLKRNDPLNTKVIALVDEHLNSRLGATRDEFISYLLASITTRITEQVKSQLL
ncbi:hypothetical protein Tco_1277564 [Tanacetum coccineum]